MLFPASGKLSVRFTEVSTGLRTNCIVSRPGIARLLFVVPGEASPYRRALLLEGLFGIAFGFLFECLRPFLEGSLMILFIAVIILRGIWLCGHCLSLCMKILFISLEIVNKSE